MGYRERSQGLHSASIPILFIALADTAGAFYLWKSPRGDESHTEELYRTLLPFDGGFISIHPASYCSVNSYIERFCSPVLHWLGFIIIYGVPLLPSVITWCLIRFLVSGRTFTAVYVYSLRWVCDFAKTFQEAFNLAHPTFRVIVCRYVMCVEATGKHLSHACHYDYRRLSQL